MLQSSPRPKMSPPQQPPPREVSSMTPADPHPRLHNSFENSLFQLYPLSSFPPITRTHRLQLHKIKTDFERILGWELRAGFVGNTERYGTARPKPVSYTPSRFYIRMTEKEISRELLKLNRFLLDGWVDERIECGFSRSSRVGPVFKVGF